MHAAGIRYLAMQRNPTTGGGRHGPRIGLHCDGLQLIALNNSLLQTTIHRHMHAQRCMRTGPVPQLDANPSTGASLASRYRYSLGGAKRLLCFFAGVRSKTARAGAAPHAGGPEHGPPWRATVMRACFGQRRQAVRAPPPWPTIRGRFSTGC